jgi:hypothetical protein
METDLFELSIGDLGVKTTHGRGHKDLANIIRRL